MTLPESRAAILEWLKKGEHLPVKKIHFERVSFDNGDFSYEFGQHPIGFIAIYENNFEHRADARRFSEFIASSRTVTEHVQAYMEAMEKRVAELEARTRILEARVGKLRKDILWIQTCAEDLYREGDKGFQFAIFAREALAQDDGQAEGEK